ENNEIAQSFTNKFGKFKIKDLELDEGVYYLHYDGDKEGLKNGVQLYATGSQKIDEYEVEPNNYPKDANSINYKKIIHGKIDKAGDYDSFIFNLPKKFEDKTFTLQLDTDSKDIIFSLQDSQGKELQRTTADSNYTMQQLMLQTDTDYKIKVQGQKRTEYTFKFSDIKEHNATNEAEPNNNLENSYGMNVEESINGFFTGYEWDCYHFTIDKANRLWSMSAVGATITSLELSAGKPNNRLFNLRSPKDNRFELKNLLLLPGLYNTCIKGTNGAYTFTINEASLADLNLTSLDDIEHEPNQDKSQMNALEFGQTIKGMVENKRDEDYFYFTLNNYENIRLTAIPPKEGDVRFKLDSNLIAHSSRPKIGQQAIIEGIYPPGRYTIDLWSKKPSYGLYSLKLERLNFFESTDIEPNDTPLLASLLPRSFHLKGHTSNNDGDWYDLPFPSDFNEESNITISGHNIKNSIVVCPNKEVGGSMFLKWNDEDQTYSVTLKNPSTSCIAVRRGIGFYDFNVSFEEYQAKIPKELDISVKITSSNSEVAAYCEYGQRLQSSVSIKNLTDKTYDLHFDSHSSDLSWKLENNQTNIHLDPKEEKIIPFAWAIPKNVSQVPVLTTLKFADQDGNFKTASLEIKPMNNATVVNPYEDWGVPKTMLGGLNVARLDFGAKRVIEHNETSLGSVRNIGKSYHRLFDDIVYKSGGFYLYERRQTAEENVTIELIGDKPSQIVGVILNPLSQTSQKYQLKDFSISLSLDGKEYKSVYRGTLGLEAKEQAFAFDRNYPAKYARLTLYNSYQNKPKGSIGLGEWKVVAEQESLHGVKAFNIANPKLGGHVVKSTQDLSGYCDKNILTEQEDIGSKRILKNTAWVVGFYHERVAKITDIVWKESLKHIKHKVNKVKVLVSTQTPTGPWKEVDTWIKNDANESIYHFEKPTWARYVKFVPQIESTKTRSYWTPPEVLRIYEEKPGATYKSILGEWGESSHRSHYEYQQSQAEDKNKSIITGNESKEKAFDLDMNQTVKGRVSVANHEEDWYKINIHEDHNQFTIQLTGESSVDVFCKLFDSNGTHIKPIRKKEEPLLHTYTFDVNEGGYILKVKQPLISVIFAWDNSPSVSWYHAEIFNSVNEYIQNIQPQVDAVNLLCFKSKNKLLLSDFSDNPTVVQTIYNNFDWDCGSSDAQKALRESSEKLKEREGIKGVIIIADADDARDMKLWEVLKEVKPKVFSIRVASRYDGKPYEGIMQSWSRVNNGTYAVVSDGIGMSKAINQASSILRRPVYYTLNTQSQYERPLGPGSLQIVEAPENKKRVNKNFAIELILDASGSMLKRIKGKRRISIAKDVLKKAVTDIIPPKTLVALRVFGHKKADSCRTDLEMKLQPLNVKKTTRIISKINAKNLAKTPIADSLAKVASDLSKVKGKKVVILVTDGKETCDGDPAKVIASLKEQGIDVRINIVGFAIDDEQLKEQFKEWARLGDGTYFDASDKKSLDDAVKKALQIPYKVYDKEEKMLAEGIVGSDPIRLKGGTYKVVIESSPEQVLEDVIVIGEQDKQITFKYEDKK
ncbi:MAG: VWA domain-containing protein, partial [Bacteroidales bacterium]|nr:VWA domain-containing protein [Bacteroidales bacterium]